MSSTGSKKTKMSTSNPGKRFPLRKRQKTKNSLRLFFLKNMLLNFFQKNVLDKSHSDKKLRGPQCSLNALFLRKIEDGLLK